MVSIGENIRKARIKRGLSQEELARAIGITKSTISKYELGHREPPLDTIQKIADVLFVSFLDLIDEDDSSVSLQSIFDGFDGIGIDKKLVWYDNAVYAVPMKPIERIVYALDLLNSSGQYEAAKRVEELTEIPRYRRSDTPPASPEGKDTPEPLPPPETPENGR